MAAIAQTPTLEELLKLPETEPPSEFIKGEVRQKPMPQGKHSRLQFKLCTVIATIVEESQIAGVFPELRCTFGGASIVPDVAIVRWQRIPRDELGQVANRFKLHPDWAIEILSPGQNQTNVLENFLHCSEYGTELGWLLNPLNSSVLVVFENQRVQVLRGDRPLPVLSDISLSLTVEQVFSWLLL